jgi:hypothetical protein
MRKLISDASFGVFIVAMLVGLAAFVAGHRVLAVAVEFIALAAYGAGWLATPELEVPESCPDCLGFIWLPVESRSIEECQTCRQHPGLAA